VTTTSDAPDEGSTELEVQTWGCSLCGNSVSTFVRLSSNPWCSNHPGGAVVMQLAE
jgi:hypothetical protein